MGVQGRVTIPPDGIIAAAERELDFHPITDKGKPITAWERRGKTLYDTVIEVNNLRDELDQLKARLAAVEARPPASPFP